LCQSILWPCRRLGLAPQAPAGRARRDGLRIMSIHFTCPRCQRAFDAPTLNSGQKFDCGCGQRLQIPPAPAPPLNKTVLGKVEDELPWATPIAQQSAPETEQPPPAKKRRFECPFCHTHQRPEYCREMTTMGWVLVIPAVLSCVGLIIWLCCLEQLKETVQRCYSCGMRLSQKDFW
jgi:hypothetical protein